MQNECQVVKVVGENGKRKVTLKHECDPTRLVVLEETKKGWRDEGGVDYPPDYIEL